MIQNAFARMERIAMKPAVDVSHVQKTRGWATIFPMGVLNPSAVKWVIVWTRRRFALLNSVSARHATHFLKHKSAMRAMYRLTHRFVGMVPALDVIPTSSANFTQRLGRSAAKTFVSFVTLRRMQAVNQRRLQSVPLMRLGASNAVMTQTVMQV